MIRGRCDKVVLCDCAGDTVVLVVFGFLLEKLKSIFLCSLVVVGLIVVLVKKLLKRLKGSSVLGMENGS